MKYRNYLFILSLLFFTSCQKEQKIEEEPLWKKEMDYTLQPNSIEYNGIPINEFDNNWSFITVASIQSIPNPYKSLFIWKDVSLTVNIDLDKDGYFENVICGTYKNKNGSEGDFIAFLQNDKIEFIHQFNDTARIPHFSTDGEVIYCGNGFGTEYPYIVHYVNNKYVFELFIDN